MGARAHFFDTHLDLEGRPNAGAAVYVYSDIAMTTLVPAAQLFVNDDDHSDPTATLTNPFLTANNGEYAWFEANTNRRYVKITKAGQQDVVRVVDVDRYGTLTQTDLEELHVNVKDHGAVGDGTTDDTAAIQSAVTAVLALSFPGILYFPPGHYRYSASLGTITKRMSVEGAGAEKTFLQPLSSYTGFALTVDQANYGTAGPGRSPQTIDAGTLVPTQSHANVTFKGFTIFGDRATTANGIRFTKGNDRVWMQDVNFSYLNGCALAIGSEDINGLMRESHFHKVRLISCGSATRSGLEISQGTEVNDGTNQLTFVDCEVLWPLGGNGIRIWNPVATGGVSQKALRRIAFTNLMLHGSSASVAPPDAHLATIEGLVRDVQFLNLRANASKAGYACVYVTDGASGTPANIDIDANIHSTDGHGVWVNRVENINIQGTCGLIAASHFEARFDANSVTNMAWVQLIPRSTSQLSVDTTVVSRVFGLTGDRRFSAPGNVFLNVKDYGAVGNGVVDDTVPIKNAITAAANGVVFFPPGTYGITRSLNNILNGTILRGVPGASTIKALPTFNTEGSMYNATNRTNVAIEDLIIDGTTIPTQFIYGTFFSGCTGVRIRRSTIKGMTGANAQSVWLATCTDARVEDCTISDSRRGITIFQGSHIKVLNSTIRNNTDYGIYILGDATARPEYVDIEGNYIHTITGGTPRYPIHSTTTAGTFVDHLRVIGNRVKGTNAPFSTTGNADLIAIYRTRGAVVQGNLAWDGGDGGVVLDNALSATIQGNVCWRNDSHGIIVARANNSIVDGNVCYNNGVDRGGTLGAAPLAGIVIMTLSSTGSNDCIVTANRCYDDQTPKTQKHGVAVQTTASNRTLIASNNLRDNLTSAISDGGTGTVLGTNVT